MRTKKIALIGAMGSGKSSLARKYVKRFGGTAIDTDAEFTRRYGDISAFFEHNGEYEFRKREQSLIVQAAESDASIIATGGGAVLNRVGMNALRRYCDIVYLCAPLNVLKARIASSSRPLKNDLEKILKSRERLYKKYADYTVDTSDDSLVALLEALKVPRKNRYDIVLCDADDTVLDFQAAMKQSLLYAARAVGIVHSDEHILSVYKNIIKDVWRRLERGEISRNELNGMRFGMLAQRLGGGFDIDEINRLYTEKMTETRFVRYGATEFLQSLRSRGIKIYIITNGFANMARERLKPLASYIDGAFISEEIGYDKPNPEFFNKVFSAIGYPEKDRVLVVGDGITSDIEGGIGYGLDTCLYDPSDSIRSNADFSAADYKTILDII